jgi:DUF971 family protein
MSEEETAPTPTELRAPAGARWMEIDWADGSSSRIHHAILRGFCPCAHCQGHQGPIRWVEGADAGDLELTHLEEVGNYALRLVWGDGHGTGIYTFRFLRTLGAIGSAEPAEVKDESLKR